MTWVLILSFVIADYHTSSGMVHSVPGFQSREACLHAGNAWLDQTRPNLNTYTRVNALCVPQGIK